MKVEKRLFLLLILSSVLATMFLASLTNTAHAQVSTQLILQPITPSNINFLANYTTLPTTITFNITVMNVTDMGAWQLTIEWNETLLSYNSISLPSDNVLAGQNPVVAGPDLSVAGQLTYGAAAGPSQPGFNGSGVLAQLVLGLDTPTPVPSSSPVDFEGIPSDTFLTALNLADIPFTAVTSTFSTSYAIGTSVTHTLPGTSELVVTQSNGTIAPNSAVFDDANHKVSFNVTGTAGDSAFLYAEVPRDKIDVASDWNVTLNGLQIAANRLVIAQNTTYTNLLIPQFLLEEETSGVGLIGIQGTIPELSTVLAILTIASASTAIIVKSRTKKK